MSRELHLSSIFLDQDWWVGKNRPKRILNQKFATVLTDVDLSNPDEHLYKGFKSRPRMPASMKASGSSEVKIDENGFQVFLDLDEFELEDINVKTFDRYVEVHGKHEEKRDEYGLVSREFLRRFMVPYNCDIETLTSSFLPDNKLIIKANSLKEEPRVYSIPMNAPEVAKEFYPQLAEVKQEYSETIEKIVKNVDMLVKTNENIAPECDDSKIEFKRKINLQLKSKEDLKILYAALCETDKTFQSTSLPTKIEAKVASTALPTKTEAKNVSAALPTKTEAQNVSTTLPTETGVKVGSTALPTEMEAKNESTTLPTETEAKIVSTALPTKTEAKNVSTTLPTETGVKVGSIALPTKTEARNVSTSLPIETGVKVGSTALPTKTGAKNVSTTLPTETEAKVVSTALPTETGAKVTPTALQTNTDAKVESTLPN